MEITQTTIRSGRTEINKESAKGMGKEEFLKTFKGKLSDPIDDVWSAINDDSVKKEIPKTKPPVRGGSSKTSHQQNLTEDLEKK